MYKLSTSNRTTWRHITVCESFQLRTVTWRYNHFKRIIILSNVSTNQCCYCFSPSLRTGLKSKMTHCTYTFSYLLERFNCSINRCSFRKLSSLLVLCWLICWLFFKIPYSHVTVSHNYSESWLLCALFSKQSLCSLETGRLPQSSPVVSLCITN